MQVSILAKLLIAKKKTIMAQLENLANKKSNIVGVTEMHGYENKVPETHDNNSARDTQFWEEFIQNEFLS